MVNLRSCNINEVVLDAVDHGEHDGTILVTIRHLEVFSA